MLQNPESVLSLNVKMLSQESTWLVSDSTDKSLMGFFFFLKHGNTTWCSAGQSQTCSHSLQAINQYAGPTGRETCGLIYEKVLDFFFFFNKLKSNQIFPSELSKSS